MIRSLGRALSSALPIRRISSPAIAVTPQSMGHYSNDSRTLACSRSDQALRADLSDCDQQLLTVGLDLHNRTIQTSSSSPGVLVGDVVVDAQIHLTAHRSAG